MTDVAGFRPTALPWLPALFGLGLVLGNVIGARAADRHLAGTLLVASAAMLIVLLVFARAATATLPAATARTCWRRRPRCRPSTWAPAVTSWVLDRCGRLHRAHAIPGRPRNEGSWASRSVPARRPRPTTISIASRSC
jgi:predicted MFS family arabinose efflux permease